MNKALLKNKKVMIGGGIGLVLLVLIGAFLLFSGKSGSQVDTNNLNALPTQVPVPALSADSIGLTMKIGTPGQSVVATVAKPEGISSIDYELSYTSEGNIPRGALGKFNLAKNPVSMEIKLGTCSDVCHYDKGVTDIKIILKITKDDGKVYQSEQTLASAE